MFAQIFENRFLDTLNNSEIWPEGPAVFLLAYSGGPDSQALLHVLMRLKHADESHAVLKDANFVLCHFKHGWRPEKADAEEAFCQTAAKTWGLDYQSDDTNSLKASLPELELPPDALGETAARLYRQAFLEKVKKQYSENFDLPVYILYGHHADDRIETILLNLFRGTGIEGLTAMPFRNGSRIRPLLTFSKTEIIQYLDSLKISYLDDPSNAEPITPRNRLRNELIPVLKEIFPTADKQIANCSGQLEKIKEELLYPAINEALAELDAQALLVCGLHTEISLGIYINKSSMRKAIPVLHAFIWKRLIEDLFGNSQNLGSAHFELLAHHLADTRSRKQAYYENSLLVSDKEAIRLWTKMPHSIEAACFLMLNDKAGDEVKFLFFANTPDTNTMTALFEKAKTLSYNFLTWFNRLSAHPDGQWRVRKPSDFVRMKNGQRKSLKKFMSEQNVPFELRDQCLVFCHDDEVLCFPTYFFREMKSEDKNKSSVKSDEVRHDG